MRTLLILFVLALLSGCSALRKATASSQWTAIEPPTSLTNEIEIREWKMVNEDRSITNQQQVIDFMCRGTTYCNGPADIKKSLVVKPDGSIELAVETKNSTWLGALFQGLWSTASGGLSWIAQAVSGAKPM